MRKAITGAALIGLLALAGTSTAQSEFPGKWQQGFHAGISKALAKHQIRGCPELRYKESKSQSGVFMVECSEDGKDWTAYRVNVSSLKVKKQ